MSAAAAASSSTTSRRGGRMRRRLPADFFYDVHPTERESSARTLASSDLSHRLRYAGATSHVSIVRLLARRSAGLGLPGRRHPLTGVSSRYPANSLLKHSMEGEGGNRMYNCRYSPTPGGQALLVTSSQDELIRFYDAGDKYRNIVSLPAQNVTWTVTSIDLSADSLVYSTMNQCLNLVRLAGLQQLQPREGDESAPSWGSIPGAGATAAAAAAGGAGASTARSRPEGGALRGRAAAPSAAYPQLSIDLRQDTARGGRGALSPWEGGFGVYSCVFGADGAEVVAGCSNNNIVVYDLQSGRVSETLRAHDDDINAVCFADTSTRSNILISGSDDATIKVWDRRLMGSESTAAATAAASTSGSNTAAAAAAGATAASSLRGRGGRPRAAEPSGVLLGHTQGITSLCAKGDGNHILSNAKDQTAKLFDLRRMGAPAGTVLRDSLWEDGPLPRIDYDYRMGNYPGWSAPPHRMKADRSLVTYRGHVVLSTLVRACFSNSVTSGQRYVLTGSADHGVYTYEALTGEVVAVLRGHRGVVRDVSAHPTSADHVASASWDGSVKVWSYSAAASAQGRKERAARRSNAVRVIARNAAAAGGSSSDQEDGEDDCGDSDGGVPVSSTATAASDDGDEGGGAATTLLGSLRAIVASTLGRRRSARLAAARTFDDDDDDDEGDTEIPSIDARYRRAIRNRWRGGDDDDDADADDTSGDDDESDGEQDDSEVDARIRAHHGISLRALNLARDPTRTMGGRVLELVRRAIQMSTTTAPAPSPTDGSAAGGPSSAATSTTAAADGEPAGSGQPEVEGGAGSSDSDGDGQQ